MELEFSYYTNYRCDICGKICNELCEVGRYNKSYMRICSDCATLITETIRKGVWAENTEYK